MVQSVLGMIMDAITIGIVFARISHPKQRGRTIAISDSAVISRRDGILKFMFRIADIRRTQVNPELQVCHSAPLWPAVAPFDVAQLSRQHIG